MAIRSVPGVLLMAAVGLAGASCGDDGPGEAGTVCTYSIAPATHAIGPDGGPLTVSVTAPASCAWAAASGAPWASVTSGATGSGNGSVVYTVAANTATDVRTATLTIATQTHTLTQQGRTGQGCTLALEPASADLPKDAATGNLAVNVQGGCAWTAVSNADWLLVTSSPEGAGNGSVSYAVSRNNAITGRTGAITPFTSPAIRALSVNDLIIRLESCRPCWLGATLIAIAMSASGGRSDVIPRTNPSSQPAGRSSSEPSHGSGIACASAKSSSPSTRATWKSGKSVYRRDQ